MTPKTHKTRSTFFTRNTLFKLFCKPKHGVAAEYKNSNRKIIEVNPIYFSFL